MPRVWRPTKKLGVERTSRYDLSAIEGFILVVHTSLGGDQLVFRYPPVGRTNISEETWTAVVGRSKPSDKQGGDATGSGSSSGARDSSSSGMSTKASSSGKAGDTPTSPNEPPVSISYADTYTPYDMPSVMLCNILSPKQSLCDRMFHTIIDQYRFFGFPTMVQKDIHESNDGVRSEESSGSAATTPSLRMRTSNDGKSGRGENASTASFHASSTTGPSSLRDSGGKETLNSSSASVSSAASTSANAPSSSAATSTQQHKDELTMFNLVMVVPKEVSWEVSLVGQRMAVQIASALRHEQDRCHYVSSEVFKMLRLRERWFTQHRKQQSSDSAAPPSHTALTYEILQNSSLAQMIKTIYHSLRDEGAAQLAVNGWVQLSLNARSIYIPSPQSTHEIPSTSRPLSTHEELNSLASRPRALTPISNQSLFSSLAPLSNNGVSMALRLINDQISHLAVQDMRPLRPYHTILILNLKQMDGILPLDASPSLRRLIDMAAPTKSFREMQLELGIPLEHLYRIAAHLVYWKKAKIIDVLTRNNLYVLNPQPHDLEERTTHLPFLAQQFETQFQNLKLIDLLSRFSTPKRLADVLQLTTAQSKFVEMVTWLIRHDLITQIHQFVFLLAPKLTSSMLHSNNAENTTHTTSFSSSTPSQNVQRDLRIDSHIAGSNESISASNEDIQRHNLINNATKIVETLQSLAETKKKREKNSKKNFSSSPLHLLLAPIPLTPSERLSLSQLDNGSKEWKMFVRLCPYFRGSHHLTEIAWRENITKEELLKVIGMYKHLVVTTLCSEDGINGSPD